MSFSSFSRSSSGCISSFFSYEELIKRNLQRGDLIEIDRGNYNHWAFYAGECENGTHWCFHVTTTDDGDFEIKEALKFANGSKAVAAVRKHKLKDILADNESKKPSMARVNNKICEARVKNCVPLDIDRVIEDLENRKDIPIPYHLQNSNCEHNVTEWRYGSAWSSQVDVVEIAIFSTLVVAVVGLFAGILKNLSGSNKNKKDIKK